MIYKIPFIFLFFFLLMLTVLMGSQCATRLGFAPPQGTHFPNNNPTSPKPPLDPDGCDPALEYCDGIPGEGDQKPSLPKNDRYAQCHREQLNQLIGQTNARPAIVDAPIHTITDYYFGQRLDFDPKCSRMFLTMSKTHSGTYRGELDLAFQIGSKKSNPNQRVNFDVTRHKTGYADDHFQYNKWIGNKFYAIFEIGKDEKFGALILHLTDLRTRDIADGKRVDVGAGELYYKMFRSTTVKSDVCFSQGTYMKNRRGNPPQKKTVCWFIPTGPWSCRPLGVLATNQPPLTRIDITRNLKCYNRLGSFFNLIIQDSFNVGSLSEL